MTAADSTCESRRPAVLWPDGTSDRCHQYVLTTGLSFAFARGQQIPLTMLYWNSNDSTGEGRRCEERHQVVPGHRQGEEDRRLVGLVRAGRAVSDGEESRHRLQRPMSVTQGAIDATDVKQFVDRGGK